MGDVDLIVVGAGAKAAALAAKAHVLNGLGSRSLSLSIIEAREPAASWLGLNGMTSGEEPLAISPVKDVGFPYLSVDVFGAEGAAIDRALAEFSWQQHLIETGEYARWVNAGSPAVRHRDYGRYVRWVLARATSGVSHIEGRAARVTLDEDRGAWEVLVREGEGERRIRGRALVLTGAGVHRELAHEPAAAARVFHCDSPRGELEDVLAAGAPDVAIVGGGESAASCFAFLRSLSAEVRMTLYAPTLPMSRGESSLENRVFADPDAVSWSELDLQTRRDFVRHCDRGVLDPQTLSLMADDGRCDFVTGRVIHVAADPGSAGVRIDFASAAGVSSARHDYVVNCTGFDPLAQLRGLLPAALGDEIERRVGPIWEPGPEDEVPIGRSLELEGLTPRLHIPALAGLRQGPGFANLGCLGQMSARILAPLWAELGARAAERAMGTAS